MGIYYIYEPVNKRIFSTKEAMNVITIARELSKKMGFLEGEVSLEPIRKIHSSGFTEDVIIFTTYVDAQMHSLDIKFESTRKLKSHFLIWCIFTGLRVTKIPKNEFIDEWILIPNSIKLAPMKMNEKFKNDSERWKTWQEIARSKSIYVKKAELFLIELGKRTGIHFKMENELDEM